MFCTEEQKRGTATLSLSQKQNKTKAKTGESLKTINFFSNNGILKIIRNLDPNKARGCDMISIRMVKICHDSICQALKLIFGSCLESGKFPSECKKSECGFNS